MKSSSGLVLPGGMTKASYLISMVFEIRHPKSPGNNMPPERKPCLKHLQQSGAQIGHHQHMF